MKPLSKAIFRTLAYADVFDYPLKKEEIWQFLLSDIGYRISDIEKALEKLPRTAKKEGYYYLRGRRRLVSLRQKRARWSREKLKIGQRVANWLKFIPTIKMVAVTGALAMANTDKEDDIDLMIVTTKNRLWLTRLLAVLLIEVVASRRRPGDQKARDKICLNMFLDEVHLAIPKKERDLFSAHEVGQMKVLWEKDGTYPKFLKANQWVKQYLPNWKP